jgi:hypothetical protein
MDQSWSTRAMTNLGFKTAIATTLFAALTSLANAGPEECREAIDHYASAKSDVGDALCTYANCVSGSQGRDDCSSEFSTIRSAQDDFESAVSSYETECQ